MKSNSSNGQLTAQISIGDHKKSGFDLSHNELGTGRIGRIIPTRALHVMPGDTIKADSKCAVQFEPLAVPILANMDVKQEHFYVPYNVVWENWDKFISAGEKMDYKGVVPNKSMKDIITAIMEMFSQHFTLTGSYTDIRFDNGGGLQYDFKAIEITTDMFYDPPYSDNQGAFVKLQQYMLDRLDTIGETYQIKDILHTQRYLIENVLPTLTYNADNVSHKVDATVFVRIPRMYGDITYSDAVAKAREMYGYLGISGNKYMEKLFDYIAGLFFDQENDVYILTDYGVRVFRFLYDLIKPFVGLSSNMDYLGMRVVTFEAYLMSQLMYANFSYVQEQHQNGTEFVFRTINYGYSEEPMSFLNLRANYSIWYNNYRDILLESDAQEPVKTDNISDVEIFTLLVPRQRCWQKDAFTTALDNPGTGNVGVPITRVADGEGGYIAMIMKEYNQVGSNIVAHRGSDNDMEIAEISFSGETYRIPTAYLSGNSPLQESTLELSGFSLYSLDAAQRAQKFIQKALFYGNRINDFYNIRFGVKYLDARLRLPELLTSSSELVGLQVVMNNTNITTEAGGEIHQSIAGDRAAYASAYDNGNSFDRFCEEHGVIMSFLTVMPQVTYAYGIDRDYSRLDQFDYAFPEFATLGMDAVYDSEITSSAIEVNKSQVFGYQGKYYDYKAKHSREHGELLDSQDMYTFARHYNMLIAGKAPKLNYEFVHCFPDLDMFVVNNPLDDYFRYDIRHSTAAERELPAQSIYI